MNQLLQDLHDLMGEVDRGWCAYKTAIMVDELRGVDFRSTHVSFGSGGCLVEEMVRVTGTRDYNRHPAMVRAMGFNNAVEMFVWNDEQRDPDVIKRRIKDAIEKLG